MRRYFRLKTNSLFQNTITLFVASIFLAACTEADDDGATQSPPEVTVAKPVKRSITDWDEYTGRFQAVDRVEVRSRVSGYLDQVLFNDGDMVKAGDVLFIIDQRPFQIAMQQSEALMKQAMAQNKQAQNDFKRAESLLKSRAISEEDFDQRQQSLLATQAQLEAAQAALQNARLNLEFTEVIAPVSGRVGRDVVNVGNLVSGGTANATLLTTIVSLDPIHFYFEASEAEMLKYVRLSRSGQRPDSRSSPNPIFVKLQDEADYVHEGSMDFVDNELDASTGTILGRALFPNSESIIQPGMFGRARLLGSNEYEALLIPDTAINTDQSKKFVYVVNDDNEATRTYLELGALLDDGMRVVLSGLDENKRVVINGIQRIRGARQAVTPVERNQAVSGVRQQG